MSADGASTIRMAGDFLDSNVLLYLLSTDAEKADTVERLLARGGMVSIQVFNEIASVALRKFGKDLRDVRHFLQDLRRVCDIVPTDLGSHERGLDIAERYRFSIHDSMLIAAALQAECTTFYSEDLQRGQRIENLTIRSPLRP